MNSIVTDGAGHTDAVPPAAPTLAARLKSETAETHESMHELMGSLSPFDDRARYVRFVMAQYIFQRRVRAVCENDWVQARVPDLDYRGRADAALADMADLDDVTSDLSRAWLATDPAAQRADAPITPVQALGWLYVSEGSTLGAAFLFKAAQQKLGLSEAFGARNLAAAPEGRMTAWRAFVTSLDSAGVTQAEADEVVQGAHDAFAFFGQILRQAFVETPPQA